MSKHHQGCLRTCSEQWMGSSSVAPPPAVPLSAEQAVGEAAKGMTHPPGHGKPERTRGSFRASFLPSRTPGQVVTFQAPHNMQNRVCAAAGGRKRQLVVDEGSTSCTCHLTYLSESLLLKKAILWVGLLRDKYRQPQVTL